MGGNETHHAKKSPPKNPSRLDAGAQLRGNPIKTSTTERFYTGGEHVTRRWGERGSAEAWLHRWMFRKEGREAEIPQRREQNGTWNKTNN